MRPRYEYKSKPSPEFMGVIRLLRVLCRNEFKRAIFSKFLQYLQIPLNI